jgi:hypothetical protein
VAAGEQGADHEEGGGERRGGERGEDWAGVETWTMRPWTAISAPNAVIAPKSERMARTMSEV